LTGGKNTGVRRYLQKTIATDLERKMVFLGGPRQAGKTTLAKVFLRGEDEGYLNWDDEEDRRRILERRLPDTTIWVLDEIHKYRGWRNFLKGLFDKQREKRRFLITGSAKLDYYRYGGDSLQGRYHYLRLHPFSVAELGIQSTDELEQLFLLGGFPEPFLSGSQKEARRWSREYRTRVVREEITKLEQVQNLDTLEIMSLRLSELVGSPLSINSLREDLQVSHKTVSKWIVILERLFHIYRVPPFGTARIKAVKKETKHYHFDWSTVANESARFENMVAGHLLKWCHFIEDTEGIDMELRYFRDIEGKEVDFVVLKDRKPSLFIECKWNDSVIAPPLRYLKRKFRDCRSIQLLWKTERHFVSAEGIEVMPALKFLRELV
jgi:predicted AAA+ superfamily ATPase